MKTSNLTNLYNLFLVHVTYHTTYMTVLNPIQRHSFIVVCGEVPLCDYNIIFYFVPLHSSDMPFVLHSFAFQSIMYELSYSEYFHCQTACSLTLWLYSPVRNFDSFWNVHSKLSTQHPSLVFLIYVVS